MAGSSCLWHSPRPGMTRACGTLETTLRNRLEVEESLEERGEVCLAEEVERYRRLGLSDGEIASKMGVDAIWVESVVSSEEEEPGPDAEDRAVAET
jgi:hypothetical protein